MPRCWTCRPLYCPRCLGNFPGLRGLLIFLLPFWSLLSTVFCWLCLFLPCLSVLEGPRRAPDSRSSLQVGTCKMYLYADDSQIYVFYLHLLLRSSRFCSLVCCLRYRIGHQSFCFSNTKSSLRAFFSTASSAAKPISPSVFSISGDGPTASQGLTLPAQRLPALPFLVPICQQGFIVSSTSMWCLNHAFLSLLPSCWTSLLTDLLT